MTAIESPKQALENQIYALALKDLLYQLADDDFLISFRGSEWLGLAPHVEEDVAFSSITQNTMGHAFLFYSLLEDLGAGDADKLAHARPAKERKNTVYAEKRNGDGSYLEDPYYDWALTVVRYFLYEVFKKVKLEAITNCSYRPLANVAKKVLMEQPYHLAHWRLWFQQLQEANEDAAARIQQRVEEAWRQFGDAFDLGPYGTEMQEAGLIADEETLWAAWFSEVQEVIQHMPAGPLEKQLGSGRFGEHTADLDHALHILSEVYNSDREAVW